MITPVNQVLNGWVQYRTQLNAVEPIDLGTERQLPAELVLGELRSLDTFSDAVVVDFLRHGQVGVTAGDLGLGVWYQPPTPKPRGVHIHVGDVALILRCAQACANHWVQHSRAEPLYPAWEFMRAEDRLGAPFLLDQLAGTHRDAVCWNYFTTTLNAGLSKRPPRVEVFTPLDKGPHPAQRDLSFGLFSALCIQLFNVVSDDLPIRDCANETCKNVFQRQHGRARKGQFRTEGVMFCSASCARAQAQRELRRRKKAADRQEASK